MTLLYRAVWEDNDHRPMDVLADEFREWCRSKGIDEIDIPARGTIESGATTVDVRRGDTESGRVLRAQLVERDGRAGRLWTTTATALNVGDFRGYWVDVECESEHDEQLPIAAPRLVRMILAEEGRPRRGPLAISATHRGVVDEESVDELVALLTDGERDLPLVVFSPDMRAGSSMQENVEINAERAGSAAATLAGLAQVSLLSPASMHHFNDAVPEDMRVYGGAVRTYLPGFDRHDDPERHRFWSLYTIRRYPRRAGDLVARHLSQFQHLTEIPKEWSIVRPLVARPTDEESAERVTALTDELSTSEAGRDAAQQADDLLQRIVELERERDQALDELKGETQTLSSTLQALQDEHLEDAIALQHLTDENFALRQNMKLLTAVQPGAEPAASRELDDVEFPEQSVDVVDLAADHLFLVRIHPDAPRDIGRLDASVKDRVWAQTAWQGLCALHRYAEAVAGGADTGGFWTWCERTGEWPTSKLAMAESETVMNNEELSRHRHLPIDERVEPTGRIFMQAHLKVQPGGGPMIPRIYFHDDTKGRTGLVHVGFFGPHDLVPNTKRR